MVGLPYIPKWGVWIARDTATAAPRLDLRLQYVANRAGGRSRGPPFEVTATNRRERMTQQYRIEKDSLNENKKPKDTKNNKQTTHTKHNKPNNEHKPDRD